MESAIAEVVERIRFSECESMIIAVFSAPLKFTKERRSR